MILIAQIIGLFAVATFLLSYQMKKRTNIIVCNSVSRILYVVQYLLLGAFEGAVLDVFGTFSAILAGYKEKSFFKRHFKLIIVSVNILIFASGMLMYENILSLCPLIGVMLHTNALWITDEKIIRRISLMGSPFWLIYNIASLAYGSALGDVLTMCSIIIAMYRYDFKGKKKS